MLKAEYAYTVGTLGTPSSTKTYTYGDSYTFTRKNGRELATLTKGTTSVTYNYNADSVRIKKTVNGVVHEYVVDGYKILKENYDIYEILYIKTRRDGA